MPSFLTPARDYAPGIGNAVADRTINRKLLDGSRERWSDVALRVTTGNVGLRSGDKIEFDKLHHHLRQASLLMSGRHLQHGDENQFSRNQEVFTNCSTAAMSFLSFYLLLNGSGVGRSYDDKMMLVDFNNLPIVVPVIDMSHADNLSGEIKALDAKNARHLYQGRTIKEFMVPDSREGWAKAIELTEFAAFEGNRRKEVLILDFSQVRPRGSPIGGMQNRPASGPGPLMATINNIAQLRNAGIAPWRSTMYADHYLAECVLVGGARRAARMATKFWKDKTILDFIQVKRGGFLWTSNNSVTVDNQFWKLVEADEASVSGRSKLGKHAKAVFNALCEAAYHDQTGEPGIINVDRLTWKEEGVDVLLDGEFAKSSRYELNAETLSLTAALADAWSDSKYKVITNPCGEIVLAAVGGYCVIADVVPFHSEPTGGPGSVCKPGAHWTEWDADAEDAFRTAVRALIRTNLMDSLYSKEVARTNRIGVGMTGLHEYAWTRFGYGWKDIVNEQKSMDFWLTLSRFSNACVDEARQYSTLLGVPMPHTITTMKPAGCATLDTKIKTEVGVMSLADLFKVNGHSLESLKQMNDGTWIEPSVVMNVMDENNVPKEVTKLYVNGIKPVFEIAFEDGTIVKLTGNHKLKTTTGWKRVDELTLEDDIIQF